MGALDLKLRKAMQLELKQMQRQVGITFIYVTHDQEEAMTMSDRLGVMSEGRLLQVGRPWDVYEYPTTQFVADFIGESNFLRGKVVEHNAQGLGVVIPGDWYLKVALPETLPPIGASISLAIRPEKVLLSLGEEHEENGLGSNALKGIIQDTIYLGTDTCYLIAITPELTLKARSPNVVAPNLHPYGFGTSVRVVLAPENLRILAEA